jgi:hypothetical protein
VITAFVFYDYQHPLFWITLLFFGVGGIALVVKTFFSNQNYVGRNSSKALLLKSQRENEFLNALGNFTYDDYGFSIKTEQNEKYIAWTEIEKMVAYKIDLYTYDEIRLVVFLENDERYEFDEETPGWFQFLERSKEQFISIDKLWELEISNPAFERKETIIYKKKY